MPIASALSIEQITRRSWMVSSSTFASETFTSPATTSPLSRILSRMSTSPCGCRWSGPRSSIANLASVSGGLLCKRLEGRSQSFPHLHRAQLHVQVFVAQPKSAFELGHLLLELHQRVPQPLDLLLSEIPGVHPPQSLLLEKT